jgi:hypothetical protein
MEDLCAYRGAVKRGVYGQSGWAASMHILGC